MTHNSVRAGPCTGLRARVTPRLPRTSAHWVLGAVSRPSMVLARPNASHWGAVRAHHIPSLAKQRQEDLRRQREDKAWAEAGNGSRPSPRQRIQLRRRDDKRAEVYALNSVMLRVAERLWAEHRVVQRAEIQAQGSLELLGSCDTVDPELSQARRVQLLEVSRPDVLLLPRDGVEVSPAGNAAGSASDDEVRPALPAAFMGPVQTAADAGDNRLRMLRSTRQASSASAPGVVDAPVARAPPRTTQNTREDVSGGCCGWRRRVRVEQVT